MSEPQKNERLALALASHVEDNLAIHMEANESQKQAVVKDLGQIAAFRLPAGWRQDETQESSDFGQLSYSRDFSPANDRSAVLSVYFRGFMISEGSAERFHNLLHEPPHDLSAEEIKSINQVLSKIADEDAFEMRSVSTAELGGRRALIIDGEWKTSQTQFHGLMLEADDSSREIQEIFFEAQIESFMKYLNVVVEAIRAIEWKKGR